MPEPRVIFFGSGEIAVPSFEWLIRSGPRPLALVTQPDKPAGRHRELTAPPIKRIALAAGIPVLQPESVRTPESIEELRRYGADLFVVMAYGQILPKKLIAIPRLACINLHGSLLPRHRGASCIQSAIEAGDRETGVTVMHMVPRLDAGDMILARTTPLAPDDTGGRVHDRLAEVAAQALAAALPELLAGTAPREPQDEALVTYAGKLERDDGRLDWSWDARRLERRIRAYDPWPGTWTTFDDGSGPKRLKIFPGTWDESPAGATAAEPGLLEILPGDIVRISCGTGAYYPAEVQPEGARRMSAAGWARGLRLSGSLKLG